MALLSSLKSHRETKNQQDCAILFQHSVCGSKVIVLHTVTNKDKGTQELFLIMHKKKLKWSENQSNTEVEPLL